MTTTRQSIRRNYPCTVRLEDNSEATLRLMTADDAERIVRFARELPEDDLLFLRIDITDPAVVRQWVENIRAGRTITVLAEVNGTLAGYAALHYNETTWQRHLAEIRVQVGPRHRGKGLGRALTVEIFAIDRDLDLRKIVAQMTPDQRAAITTFECLGFQPEALLQDFVIDRAGRTHDLVVMTVDVEGLTDRVD